MAIHTACGTFSSLNQGWNPYPLQWPHSVLTTGPLGKSQQCSFSIYDSFFPFFLLMVVSRMNPVSVNIQCFSHWLYWRQSGLLITLKAVRPPNWRTVPFKENFNYLRISLSRWNMLSSILQKCSQTLRSIWSFPQPLCLPVLSGAGSSLGLSSRGAKGCLEQVLDCFFSTNHTILSDSLDGSLQIRAHYMLWNPW